MVWCAVLRSCLVMNDRTQSKEIAGKEGGNAASAPTITLPKGGGAIRSIGEKFAANPVTGTGLMTVPIATSPGRSGFGPQLSFSYDSGSGNGPFGLGWGLALPSVTRKTDKGLPRYFDAYESDVFILSGAEDLVPVFRQDPQGNWVRDGAGKLLIHRDIRPVGNSNYKVCPCRSRIEGLFARIERWTNVGDSSEVFWRFISRDNITTWYGTTPESRIADPTDASHIFSWLICQSHDDKGNIILYGYKPEDSSGINLAQAHEAKRKAPLGSPDPRSANRYIKDIRYGNNAPYFPTLEPNSPWPEPPGATATDASKNWYFEVVFDHGERDADAPTPNDPGVWAVRNDPFSSYRPYFEVRTYRLCQRVLMFHHFPVVKDADGRSIEVGYEGLVRSTDFENSYEENPTDACNPIFWFLVSVTQSGYKQQAGGNAYLKKSLPPVEFTYSDASIQQEIHTVDAKSLENLPSGRDGNAYHWVGLGGEGPSGILIEQGEGWFYKRNLSPLPVKGNGSEEIKARFAPVELVATKPALSLAAAVQFMDLAGDGRPDLVTCEGPVRGFYERTDDPGWESLRPFRAFPNLDTSTVTDMRTSSLRGQPLPLAPEHDYHPDEESQDEFLSLINISN